MAEDPYPQTTLLSKTRLAAEHRRLEDLFDAYETFCTLGHLPLSWKLLASQLDLADQSQVHRHAQANQPPALLIEGFFAEYLRKLGLEQLGHLASDLVIAFFQVTGVIERVEHITLDRKSFSLVIETWALDSTNKNVAAVRAQLQTLPRHHLELLLRILNKGIIARSDELISYSTQAHPRYSSSSWVPCSDSHYGLLLHLDLKLDPALVQRIESATAQARPIRKWNFHSRLEPDNQTKRGSILRLFTLRPPLVRLDSIGEHDEDRRPATIAVVEPAANGDNRFRYSKYEDKRNSKRSSYSDYRSFKTALTHLSHPSMHDSLTTSLHRRSVITHNTSIETSSMQSFLSGPNPLSANSSVPSEWSETLRKRNIVPDPHLEDWSQGRGQHAEYNEDEQSVIDLVLKKEAEIGTGGTAVVESVRCKRVRLVRKVIQSNRRTRERRREDVSNEVQQLYKAQHSHIVRLVGTYRIGGTLAILTYPCAQWNLNEFLAESPSGLIDDIKISAVRKFFGCLANVLDFIHSFPIKHMDIKPQNILVRALSSTDPLPSFKVYLTDFGSSRFYPTLEDSVTDNNASFTASYAAREVVNFEPRGLEADIFSMGCVFAELLGAALRLPSASLLSARGRQNNNSAQPYFRRLDSIYAWLMGLQIDEPDEMLLTVRTRTLEMLSDAQDLRPKARKVADSLRPFHSCTHCDHPLPEAFEKADSALNPGDLAHIVSSDIDCL